jgi:hypothetical protein
MSSLRPVTLSPLCWMRPLEPLRLHGILCRRYVAHSGIGTLSCAATPSYPTFLRVWQHGARHLCCHLQACRQLRSHATYPCSLKASQHCTGDLRSCQPSLRQTTRFVDFRGPQLLSWHCRPPAPLFGEPGLAALNYGSYDDLQPAVPL